MAAKLVDTIEVQVKTLEIIQSIIERMARNSFILKGWAITVVSGVIAIGNVKDLSFLTALPLLFFWALDAYYLYLEKCFIKLYHLKVGELNRGTIDLSISIDHLRSKCAYWTTLWSRTLILLYPPIILLVILIGQC